MLRALCALSERSRPAVRRSAVGLRKDATKAKLDRSGIAAKGNLGEHRIRAICRAGPCERDLKSSCRTLGSKTGELAHHRTTRPVADHLCDRAHGRVAREDKESALTDTGVEAFRRTTTGHIERDCYGRDDRRGTCGYCEADCQTSPAHTGNDLIDSLGRDAGACERLKQHLNNGGRHGDVGGAAFCACGGRCGTGVAGSRGEGPRRRSGEAEPDLCGGGGWFGAVGEGGQRRSYGL